MSCQRPAWFKQLRELAIPPFNVEALPWDIISGKREIFVANQNDGKFKLSILSDSNNTVVATVTVGEYLTGVAYDFAKRDFHNQSTRRYSVSIVSDSNNKVVATVTVGEYPTGDSL